MRPVMAKAISYAKPDIDPSLHLYVPFNEGIGNVAKDYSQYGNYAVLSDVEWDIGLNGNVGKFNGFAFCNCGNDESLNITDAITIEAWVKPALPGNDFMSVITKGSYGYSFFFEKHGSDDYMYSRIRTDVGNLYILYPEGTLQPEWQHYVVIWTPTHSYAYLNGALKKDNDISYSSLDIGTGNIRIGWSEDSSYYFNGTIDEVRIYNRALSASDVFHNYTHSLYITCSEASIL